MGSCALCMRRPRFWLFVSYIVSFGAIVGAVWVLIEHYGELGLRATNHNAVLHKPTHTHTRTHVQQ